MRFRILLTGKPTPALIVWLQALIPLLRDAPRDVRVEVRIDPAEDERDARRDTGGSERPS